VGKVAGYWKGSHWPGEDGGPARQGIPALEPAPAMGKMRLAAHRQFFAADMLVRRDPGEWFLLRHTMAPDLFLGPTECWVERIDPGDLSVVRESPRLAGGRFWAGSLAVHETGDVLVVYGRHAHRLSADLEPKATRRLPAERPYNGFVIRPDGTVVTKDCDTLEVSSPASLVLLDPETLEDAAAPLDLGEPSIARLTLDGGDIICAGTEHVFRIGLVDGALRVLDRVRYGGSPDHSYAWDPVVAGGRIWWMDNGQHDTHASLKMAGVTPGPVRLWDAPVGDLSAARSTVISGKRHGTITNPPAWDPVARQIVAYDSGGGVIRAWRVPEDEGPLERTWTRRDHWHGPHLIVLPERRELVTADRRDPVVRSGSMKAS